MALHQVIRAELGVVWGGSLGVARFRRGRREGIGGVDEVLMPMYTTEFYILILTSVTPLNVTTALFCSQPILRSKTQPYEICRSAAAEHDVRDSRLA